MAKRQSKQSGKTGSSENGVILVVGASNNPTKYGYKIMQNLKSRGITAVPINPNEKEILGVKAYKSITEFVSKNKKTKILLVDIVVRPKITPKILEEVKKLKIGLVWIQPGAESTGAIEFCKRNKIGAIHRTCIMANYC